MKNIKFKDIVAFIERGMMEDCDVKLIHERIEVCYNYPDKNDPEYAHEIEFYFPYEIKDDVINIGVGRSLFISDGMYNIEVTDKKDILEWQMLIEKVKDYYYTKVENDFNKFYDHLNSKPTDISELD